MISIDSPTLNENKKNRKMLFLCFSSISSLFGEPFMDFNHNKFVLMLSIAHKRDLHKSRIMLGGIQ